MSVQTEVQIMIKTSDLYREQSIQTGGPMVQEQGVTTTSFFVYQGDSVMSIYVLLMGLFFQPAIVNAFLSTAANDMSDLDALLTNHTTYSSIYSSIQARSGYYNNCKFHRIIKVCFSNH